MRLHAPEDCISLPNIGHGKSNSVTLVILIYLFTIVYLLQMGVWYGYKMIQLII